MIYTLIGKKDPETVDFIISFDSISSMSEDMKADVTNQTVEEGFDITDHIHISPTEFSVDAVVSSYSIFNTENEITWDGEQFNVGDGYLIDNHISARDEIIKVFKSRSILTLLESSNNSNNEDLQQKDVELRQGRFKEHPNCVITSLSISNPESGSGAFYISLKLQQIVIANVFESELTEEQMTPAVRPLMEKEKDVSSKSKEGKKDKDDEGVSDEGFGGEDVFDEQTTPNFKKEGRLTQADGVRLGEEKVRNYENQISATRAAKAAQAIDGRKKQVLFINGYWQYRDSL